jgi:DHA2 family multidrug resistance protein-like MFS transporter
MGLLLVLAPKILPEFRAQNAGQLDVSSAALSLAAVLALIYGLKLVVQDGVGWIAALSVVVGLTLSAVFVGRQRRLTVPFIDLHLFRLPVFSVTLVIFMLNAVVMFAASFFIAQYFQLVLGLSPLQAGLWTLPAAVSVTAASMLSPTLARWRSRSAIMVAGLLLCAAGFGVLAFVGGGGMPVVVIGAVVSGLGAGPLATLVPDLVVGAVPPERAGGAASLSTTSAEFGGALGLAVLGSIGAAVYRSALAGSIPLTIPPEIALVAGETVGSAFVVARTLPPDLSTALLESARSAFAQAFVTNAAISAILMLVTAVLMLMVVATKRVSSEWANPVGSIS